MPKISFQINQGGLTVVVAGERIQLNKYYRETPYGGKPNV